MAELNGQSGSGAAQRRRQRRLALVVATRPAVDRCSLGHFSTPPSSHGDRRRPGPGLGGGARDERRATATKGASNGGAARPPRGDRRGATAAGGTLHRTPLPTIGLLVLAGASGEVVDPSSLRFRTPAAWEARRKVVHSSVARAARLEIWTSFYDLSCTGSPCTCSYVSWRPLDDWTTCGDSLP